MFHHSHPVLMLTKLTDKTQNFRKYGYRDGINLILVVSPGLLAYFAAEFYIHRALLIHLPLRIKLAFWLHWLWTPVMVSSVLYQWGGILGIIIGLSQNNSQLPKTLIHIISYATSVVLIGWFGWLIGLLFSVHISSDIPHMSSYHPVTHDILATAAVWQYIVFWAFLSYALRGVIKYPILVGSLLFVVQFAELFWLGLHYPFVEAMMPTAISRLPVALAYPVWEHHSWASKHPSLISSTPVVLQSGSTLYIRPIYAGIIEGLYMLIGGLLILWSSLSRTESP